MTHMITFNCVPETIAIYHPIVGTDINANYKINDFEQDCSNSTANALELLQSCNNKPSISSQSQVYLVIKMRLIVAYSINMTLFVYTLNMELHM